MSIEFTAICFWEFYPLQQRAQIKQKEINKEYRNIDKSTDVLRVEDNGYNVLLVPVCAGMYGRIEKQMFYAPQKEKQAKATYRRWAKKYCKNN